MNLKLIQYEFASIGSIGVYNNIQRAIWIQSDTVSSNDNFPKMNMNNMNYILYSIRGSSFKFCFALPLILPANLRTRSKQPK